MRKIRIKFGAIIMFFAMIMSDGVILLGLYFLSAALHECGHLLAACAMKIGIEEVRFDFSGVRICTENKVHSYTSELVLAVAGPLVNFIVVTAVLIYFNVIGASPALVAQDLMAFITYREYSLLGTLSFLLVSSASQGGINLLPVNTFDGGRILFCLFALIFGESFANASLKVTSFIAAFLLWTVALYLLLKVSSGLGILVFSACIFISTADCQVNK